MTQLTVTGAAFSYEGHTVVNGLNFQVSSGDYLCIVGANGSGKSTLVKGILRLKQPDTGNLRFADGLTLKDIGYLPQQTAVQKDFPASVYEVVLSGRLSTRGFRPFFSKKDKAAVLEKMDLLHITDIQKKSYRALSGGQQQRVLLARALCADRKLLLLDEPVAGLDPLVTHEFYQTIDELNQSTGVTIIMVSHDMHSALQYATHILHLENNQAFYGQTAEYLKTELAARFTGGAVHV